MSAFNASVVLVLWHGNSRFVLFETEAAYLPDAKAWWSFVADRTHARMRFVPAIAAHAVANPNLFHVCDCQSEILFL